MKDDKIVAQLVQALKPLADCWADSMEGYPDEYMAEGLFCVGEVRQARRLVDKVEKQFHQKPFDAPGENR